MIEAAESLHDALKVVREQEEIGRVLGMNYAHNFHMRRLHQAREHLDQAQGILLHLPRLRWPEPSREGKEVH